MGAAGRGREMLWNGAQWVAGPESGLEGVALEGFRDVRSLFPGRQWLSQAVRSPSVAAAHHERGRWVRIKMVSGAP